MDMKDVIQHKNLCCKKNTKHFKVIYSQIS